MTRPADLEVLPGRESRPADSPPVTEPLMRSAPGLTPATVLTMQRSGAGNHAIANALTARRTLSRFQDTPPPGSGISKTMWKKLNPVQQEAAWKRHDAEQKDTARDEKKQTARAGSKHTAEDGRSKLIADLRECEKQLTVQQRALQAAKAKGVPVTRLVTVNKQLTPLADFIAKQAQTADINTLKQRITNSSNAIKLAKEELALPAAASSPWQVFCTQIRDDVRNAFRTERWDGDKGGEFNFRVTKANADDVWQFCADEFHEKEIQGWDQKGQEPAMQQYKGPRDKMQVRYYVTERSTSGASFCISAHVWANGKDTRTSMVVLHVPRGEGTGATKPKDEA